MTYSINVLNNEGDLYHIQLKSTLVLEDCPDDQVPWCVDDKKVQRILIKCGFNPEEVYYECIPSPDLNILNYEYKEEVVGKLKRIWL